MREKIIEALKKIETERDIRILYACESGSRAWGFPSPDSDWDVRFIYVHPLPWYLQLEKQRDTIDVMLPDELDLCGWELRKTLQLFAGCNPALNEWLASPQVYLTTPLREELLSKLPRYFNAKKAIFHYLKMAERSGPKNVKKLFYALRAVLACHWIASEKTMPPTEFKTLFTHSRGAELPEKLAVEITSLREQKHALGEKEAVSISQPLLTWLDDQLTKLPALAEATPAGGCKETEVLSELLRRLVTD